MEMTTLEETECLTERMEFAQLRETLDAEARQREQITVHLPDGASAPRTAGDDAREQRRPQPPMMGEDGFQRSALRLPVYRGEGPPDAYLAQARLAARFLGCSPEETAVRIALSLEGKALKILSNLLPREQHDWAEIQGALYRRFGQRVSREDAREELSSRQRQEKEKEKLGAIRGRSARTLSARLPPIHRGGSRGAGCVSPVNKPASVSRTVEHQNNPPTAGHAGKTPPPSLSQAAPLHYIVL